MYTFDENFKIAVENRFKKFLVISIMGLKKDYYRKEISRAKREPLLYDTELNLDELSCHYDEVFDGNLMETTREDLFLALKSLTAKQLQIIKLLELEDLTEAEVAKLLNITQQGVSKAKKRAIKKMEKLCSRR